MWNGLDNGMLIRVEKCGVRNALYNQTTQEILLCWELYDDVIDTFNQLEVSQGNPEDLPTPILCLLCTTNSPTPLSTSGKYPMPAIWNPMQTK